MTIHYHGTPITPRSVLHELAGHCFCVSYWKPQDVEICHSIGQSVMIDNGAFSAWKAGKTLSYGETQTLEHWRAYYAWAEVWLIYWTTWAVIPDVIDGSETMNDSLIAQWPHGHRGAPVWHFHESLDRLRRLCDEWPRVCLGSSGQYAELNTPQWHNRMTQAMNMVCREGRASTWLHMLRGMAMVDAGYPFASVDSTDIGRNHNRPQNEAKRMAQRWDAIQSVGKWQSPGEQMCIG